MGIIRREPLATIGANETIISMVLENERGDVVIDSEALDKILAEFDPPQVPLKVNICLGWNGGKLFADRGALSGVEVIVEDFGPDWIVVRDLNSGRGYATSFSHRVSFSEMRKLLED